MTESRIDCYHLPVASIGGLTTYSVDKLNSVLTPEGTVAPFTALDCFDQSLRRSGRLLLKTDTAFELISTNSRIISTSTNRKVGFAADFPNGRLKQALAGLSPLRRLLPAGSGKLQQAVLTLIDDQGKTHCRAYLMFFTAQKGRSAALAMLQGIKGYDTSLSLLRERVRELGGTAFKSDTLYGQLFPTKSAYDAKPKILITSDASAFDAANKIISTHIPIAWANERGIIADHDTKFLHDYRIQLRKIRSLLSLLEGIYDDAQAVDLKTRFASLMAPTGRLRDLDVYLLEKQAYYGLVPRSLHNGLNMLYSMFAEQRKNEQIKLSHYLRSRSYKQEIADLAALFNTSKILNRGPNAQLLAHDYACDLIWKRYRKVCKIAARIDQYTPDAQVHTLRIQCKKLRYLMEFFGTMFPKAAFKKLLKPLRSLQDNLGLFNDYSVQQESLQTALVKLSESQGALDLEVAQSVGALIAVLHHRQLDERAKIVKSFAQFNSPKTQRTFSELFQERKAYYP